MLERGKDHQPPTSSIISLAKLVLELNAFQYGNKHYPQVHGTALGTRLAPSYANPFMGSLEDSLLASPPDQMVPAFFKRFIDDVFGIWLHGEEMLIRFLEHPNNCHPDITFTASYV